MVRAGEAKAVSAFATLLLVAHELDAPDTTWVDELGRAGAELLDEGAGFVAHAYAVQRGESDGLGPIGGNKPGLELRSGIEAWSIKNRAILSSIIGTGVGGIADAERAAQGRGLLLSPLHEFFEAWGIRDLVTVIAHCPTGDGLTLISPRRDRSRSNSREQRLHCSLAAQLEVAVRLRARRQHQQARALSQRQGHVLHMLLAGGSDKEIASKLGIGLSTVSTYVRRLRATLGCAGIEVLVSPCTDHPEVVLRRVTLLGRLTPTEQDIVCRLLEGASTNEIAVARGTSSRTVANQRAAIFRKCGVRGRRELAAALLGTKTRRAI